jgi:hypothetical protein
VNWTEILAKAGIPEPPGRAEAIEELRRVREVKATADALEAGAAAQRLEKRLAAKGDGKKAIRSKVRLGG